VRLVDWAKGASLMIRREALEAVGYLDEGYWLYTEEVDWCYRARQAGWQIAVEENAHVLHLEQAASRQQAGSSLVRFTQSRARFLSKRHSPRALAVFWVVSLGKSIIWQSFPRKSPLGRGRNELSDNEIASAYRALSAACRRSLWRPAQPDLAGSSPDEQLRLNVS
jgi:GT2 family glycosyltransferase